ncbi:MAG: nucleoside triphosphate pyrophosphohydrolase [Planctomycetes bacterium RIFCSPHIGHO2_02_FULL_52_58]|nr:MAG: nucleoside triphosphate pyrophosphohydrolase [Planctomycetes bacterium RIFCSPHIGHO2_02_FULL_52_58]
MQDNNLFQELVALMERLRGTDGCPWDKEQTHESLKPYLVEETYEVIDAIDSGEPAKLKEELGDLLFQVIFHAQIAKENNAFDIAGVLKGCLEKMTSRHPHVFGKEQLKTAEEVLRAWHKIKHKESGGKEKSILGSLPRHMPALQKAFKVQKKAARVGFDWEKVEDVVAKMEEELREVRQALAKIQGTGDRGQGARELKEELGDLLFAAANLSRFLKVNPEEALEKATKKFIERFKRVEAELASQGKEIGHASLEEMDRLWEAVKRQ